MAERRKDHDPFSDDSLEGSPAVLDGTQGWADTGSSEEAEALGESTVSEGSGGAEPVAYVTCQQPESGAATVRLEIYPGVGDELILLAYASLANLTAGAGEGQPWIAVPVSSLEQVCAEAGADRVVWDANLPDEWRPHDAKTGEQAGGVE